MSLSQPGSIAVVEPVESEVSRVNTALGWLRIVLPLILIIGTMAIAFSAALVPLMEPDEGRYADIPAEMLASGDFVTPRLNGVLYLEKPPLHYWATALAMRVFGHREVATRLPSLLFGLLGVLFTLALGKRMLGEREGQLAACFLATAPLYYALSTINIIDMTLTFFMTLTMGLFWFAQKHERPGRSWSWYGMFAAAALTVLAKGLVGMVLPGAIIGIFILLERRWELLRPIPLLTGTLLFTAIAAPWHIAAAQRIPGFAWFYFVHEHFLRFTTDVHDRTQPFWYFVPVLLLLFIPWIAFFPAGFAGFKLDRRRGFRSTSPEVLFLALWLGVILVFFSLSSSKLVPYVLPCFIPMALLAGRGAVRILAMPRIKIGHALGLLATHVPMITLSLAVVLIVFGQIDLKLQVEPHSAVMAFSLLALVLSGASLGFCARSPRSPVRLPLLVGWSLAFGATLLASSSNVGRYRSTQPISVCVNEQLNNPSSIDVFRSLPTTLPFYTNRRMVMVDFLGELEYGSNQLADAERRRWFPTIDEYRPEWQSTNLRHVFLERKKLPEARAAGLNGKMVCESARYVLLSNQPDPSVIGCAEDILIEPSRAEGAQP